MSNRFTGIVFFGGQGPYPPTDWPLGGFPTIRTDVGVMSLFMVLFLIAAALHLLLTIFNIIRLRRFLLSLVLFIFCIERVGALGIRIAGTLRGSNGKLYVAGVTMVYGALVLLYIANFIFAHRIIRAQHQGKGLRIIFGIIFLVIYLLVVLAWGLLMTGILQPFWRLGRNVRFTDRALRIYGFTFFAFAAILPIILVLISTIIPRGKRAQREKTGFRVVILLIGCFLAGLEAFYIAGVEWMPPRSRFNRIPDYMSRSWYYVMIFTLEFILVMLYGITRVDSRFRTTKEEKNLAANGYSGGPLPMSGAASVPVTGAPPRKKRFGKLSKLAVGAGAGAAAGGMLHHMRNKHRDKEADLERDPSPSPRDFEVTAAGAREPIVDDRVEPTRTPQKEVRGFDAETIPEVSEESDSLYGINSSLATESKRVSVASGPETESKPTKGVAL